jgi:K+-sensing histidine kinase KdpD
MEPIDVPALDEEDRAAPRAPGEVRAEHLGFVAHEIRNPLSTALWTAELLERIPPAERGGARGAKLSAMCLRSLARVRQLVEDHLLAERLDAGGLPLRVEAIALAEAVGAVAGRRPADAAPVAVQVDPALAVEGDRPLVERALEALVAVAGAGRTPVAVTARATEREVIVRVAGRAADPGALADPVKGSPGDPAGRALALPLARRIAAALGGALAAGDGGWLLTLPRAAAPAARPSPADPP